MDSVTIPPYAIPDRHSDFYRHGALLLGSGGEAIPQGHADEIAFFRSHVGVASSYGFHATIADVMYLSRNQLPWLRCELRGIARSVREFGLRIIDFQHVM